VVYPPTLRLTASGSEMSTLPTILTGYNTLNFTLPVGMLAPLAEKSTSECFKIYRIHTKTVASQKKLFLQIGFDISGNNADSPWISAQSFRLGAEKAGMKIVTLSVCRPFGRTGPCDVYENNDGIFLEHLLHTR